LKKAIFSFIYGKEIDNNLCFKECNDSHMRYALKIGVDYIVSTEFKEKKWIHDDHINYDVMAEKYGIFKRLLETYDRVLYLDGDVFIKKDSPDIFKELKDDSVYMRNENFNGVEYNSEIEKIKCDEWTKTGCNYDFYNAGVILASKNQAKLFDFRQWEYCRFENLPFISDQPFLNWTIFKYGIPVQSMSQEWNAMRYFKQDGYFIHFANTHDRNETIKEWINL
jgi:hypothetical protein